MLVRFLQEWFGDEEERTADAACYILADGSGPIVVEGRKGRVEVWDADNPDLGLDVSSRLGYCVVRAERIVGYHAHPIGVLALARRIVA